MVGSLAKEYPANLDLVKYDEVDSTNDELKRILFQDIDSIQIPDTLSNATSNDLIKAVMAVRQTEGRGRLGRSWASPPGGLYFSVALDTSDSQEKAAALSLLISLAIRKEITELIKEQEQAREQEHTGGKSPAREQEHTGGQRSAKAQEQTREQQEIQIKWPNDIVCSQGKLAGILIEQIQLPSGKQSAIIGVGINIKRPTSKAPKPAAYLSDFCSCSPNPEQTVRQIIKGIMAYYEPWKKSGYDFTFAQDEYNSSLSLHGRSVTVSNNNGEILAEGSVTGVDESGFLLLKGEGDVALKIGTGEVTLRKAKHS